jgi:hypothetical protein
MPSPFPSPWRRESRGSTEPRPDARPSSRDPPRFSYGTHGVRHVPRGETSRRVAALRERTLASTAASLRVAEHTERVAGATLRELDAQSESLERTRKNLDDAEKSAEEGERTLDEMRACGVSCFSLRGLFRSSRRTPPDAATPNLAGAESRGDIADARDELSRRAAAKRKTNQTTTATSTTTTLRSNETVSSKDDAIGANAVALSFSLDALRRASEAMGEKLDEQTRTVDDVASRSLSLRSKLARAESRGAV